jgi:hypothetical protein
VLSSFDIDYSKKGGKSERERMGLALCVRVVNLDKWNNLLMVSQSLALKDNEDCLLPIATALKT